MKNALTAKLNQAILAELANKSDDNVALRRALLHAILLLEETKEPAARGFVDYLLVRFGPLAGAFVEEKHPYLAAFEAMRARLPNGHVTVLLPIERLKAWLASGAAPTSTASSGTIHQNGE